MIFLDSNIPMYLVGADHPLKHRARIEIERLVARDESLVTSAEVLQEILHRYGAIKRWDAIGPTFRLVHRLVDTIYPILPADVEQAREHVETLKTGARDALHAAVMEREGIERILTFDRGFDLFQKLVRVPS